MWLTKKNMGASRVRERVGTISCGPGGGADNGGECCPELHLSTLFIIGYYYSVLATLHRLVLEPASLVLAPLVRRPVVVVIIVVPIILEARILALPSFVLPLYVLSIPFTFVVHLVVLGWRGPGLGSAAVVTGDLRLGKGSSEPALGLLETGENKGGRRVEGGKIWEGRGRWGLYSRDGQACWVTRCECVDTKQGEEARPICASR